jgi:hypothetical protein
MLTTNDNNLLGGREINIPEHKKTELQNISRLTSDLNFVVLELIENQARHKFVLVSDQYRECETKALTPSFSSLQELEEFLSMNADKILHRYLLGSITEDMSLQSV